MVNLIDLDQCVLDALDLFSKEQIPQLTLPEFKRPLVVGSGNAAVTGKIIFEEYDAVFADESTYKRVLDTVHGIDGALLLSASGGKHAPVIGQELKDRNIQTILLTNNADALAKDVVDQTLVLPKQTEPYTYNTSTYLSMIFSHTKEDPAAIKAYIEKEIAPKIPDNLAEYDAFYIIVPNQFDTAREMLLTKFDELFGAVVSGRVFTDDQTQHAKTVVPSDTELFISIGHENETWGTKKLNVPLPQEANYGAFIAISYYLIGNIQKQNEPYFKQHIEAYTQKVSQLFNQTIVPLVENK